jgi:hypothetical protein
MGSLTNFPFGLSSFGVPLPGGQSGPVSIPRPNGQSWFVDTGSGSDGGTGASPTDPLKTIARALQLAGNGTGDTIYVAPGSYNETLLVTKDYIALVGMVFAGYAKPDLGPALTAQIALTVKAQGFLARHIRFAANAQDCVDQQGNGFLYEDCVFDGDLTALMGGLRLVPNNTNTHLTASEGLVTGCLFRGNASGIIFDTAIAPVGVGSTDNNIIGNVFYSNTKDIVSADSGVGLYSLQLTQIIGNYFADKNKAVYIDFVTANGGAAADQTGMIANNYFNSTNALTNVLIKVNGTGFAVIAAYSAIGITNASAF